MISKCGFTILPSCSEGQAGSVVETMLHGLIPIISKQTHIDLYGSGITFKNNSIEEIVSTIKALSSKSASELKGMSKKATEVVREHHNPLKFSQDLQNTLQGLLASSS